MRLTTPAGLYVAVGLSAQVGPLVVAGRRLLRSRGGRIVPV